MHRHYQRARHVRNGGEDAKVQQAVEGDALRRDIASYTATLNESPRGRTHRATKALWPRAGRRAVPRAAEDAPPRAARYSAYTLGALACIFHPSKSPSLSHAFTAPCPHADPPLRAFCASRGPQDVCLAAADSVGRRRKGDGGGGGRRGNRKRPSTRLV